MTPHNVDATTLKRWLDDGEAIVVDVREQAEHARNHIEGSYLIPSGEITSMLLPSQTKKIVLHCNSGGRGGRTTQKLREENAALNVYNLEGGIKAWIAEGYLVNGTGDSH
ncbi:MAG: rhodanese-like domain-containing protein [Alphaproteobacteria bacterium]|nr:rhodanese-like domain-containing protein [Alphaproteobacteria bacterium]